MQDNRQKFVVDTHAFWWYLRAPERLTVAASAIFRLAETGNATIVVPAIVIAEFYYLSAKLGQPFSPADLLEIIASVDGIELSDLGRRQLELLDGIPDVPEMHDRLIAAESIVFDAPVVTRERNACCVGQDRHCLVKSAL